MYRKNIIPKTTIARNESYVGETIERKMERIMNNKEPITDGAPITYTERKDGVDPGMDIRTDRWEHAIDAKTKDAKSELAKRDQSIGERTYDTMSDDQKGEFHKKYPQSKIQPPKSDAPGGEKK